MNLPTAFIAGLRCFLVTVWCIALAMPYGWHSDYSMNQMKNFHLGLYKYKVKAGTVGEVVKLVTDADEDGKLYSLLGEGEFWMHEVEEKNCMPFVDKFAVIPGSREYCYMWRRIRTASYLLTACIILGSSCTLISVGLSYTTGTEGLQTLTKVSGIIGAAVGSFGLATYFFMTLDFPDPQGSFKLTFGPAFYVAALVGKLLMSAAVALACSNDGSEGEATMDKDAKAALKMPGSDPEQYPPGYGQMPSPPYYQTFSSQPPAVPNDGSSSIRPLVFVPSSDGLGSQSISPWGFNPAPDGASSQMLRGDPSPRAPSPRPEGLLTPPRTASPAPPVNRLSMGGGVMYRTGSPAAQNNWGSTVPPAPPSPRLRENIPGLAKSNPFD